MRFFLNKIWAFASSWTGTIIIVLLLIFFVMQAFVIPTRSMVGTLYEGDFLFVKKFSYGIPTPRIPWLEISIFPDFKNNGHLIEGERPKRSDVVVFIPPHIEKTYFVKRVFAVEGDEVLFDKDGMYLHPSEGDEYVREHFSGYVIKERLGKLFVKEPFEGQHPGIHYENIYYEKNNPERLFYADKQGKLYSRFCEQNSGEHNIGDGESECNLWRKNYTDKPISDFIEERNFAYSRMESSGYSSMQRLSDGTYYKKIEPDHFFMIGDNRNNSFDSRFWGSVAYKNIIGKPWFIYFSLTKSNSREFGADEDKTKRYVIRWDRMFKSVETLEEQMRRAMPK